MSVLINKNFDLSVLVLVVSWH